MDFPTTQSLLIFDEVLFMKDLIFGIRQCACTMFKFLVLHSPVHSEITSVSNIGLKTGIKLIAGYHTQDVK